ncbi:MAG: FAD-dependent oxidoreductase [Saccharofermentanaceae bacterium]|jgi:protoporphyrinogen oxidase|nr:NAD(P)-binding protein [Clostridiaceae bacterium]HOO48975.1 FAD-dependent oxidoreductase [Saccharofermentans sp.]HPJ81069.1 FAD-dependent oxidoreductase [Saccharofermentans sp.]HPQ32148.1 FAD-dependent oxidoreductase [Saccharofermentans sp.]
MSSVCIVGTGLSGLICGMRLTKSGYTVHIVEEVTYPGGLLASAKIGNEYLERLPHHLRKTDHALLALVKEVGLSDKLEWFNSYWHGHASGRKIGYFASGFASLINMLIQDITDNGGKISYSCTVAELTKDPTTNTFKTTCVLSDSNRVSIESDYVIFTGSCRPFVNVCHGLPIEMNVRDQLMNVTYKPQISLLMVLKKQVSEVYYRSAKDSPFQKVINHSLCFGTRGYGGNVVYLVGECAISDPLWIEDEATIMKYYFTSFRKLYPTLRETDIKSWRLTKVRYARFDSFPEMDLSAPMENLFLCSSGLSKYATTDEPANRMESVVALANSIVAKIEFNEEKKRLEQDVSFVEKESIITPLVNEING